MKTLLTLMLLLSVSLFGASFDCAKGKTNVEKIICSDPTLSKLDEKLNQVYTEALSKSNNKNKLIKEQREWIKERNEIFSDSKLIGYAEFLENRIIALEDTPPSSPDKERLIALFQHFDWDRYGGRAEMLLPREKPMLENWKQGKFELIVPTFQTENRDDPRLKKLEQQCPNLFTVNKSLWVGHNSYADEVNFSKLPVQYYRLYDVNSSTLILEQAVYSKQKLLGEKIVLKLILFDTKKCRRLYTLFQSGFGKSIDDGVLRYGNHLLTYTLHLNTSPYNVKPLYQGKQIDWIGSNVFFPKTTSEEFETMFSAKNINIQGNEK